MQSRWKPLRVAFGDWAIRMSLMALAFLSLSAGAVRAQDSWPALHVRGFSLRPRLVSDSTGLADTALSSFTNSDQTVTLLWDRDSVAEKRITFGGYAVYRSVGPYPGQATLLRRYVKQPALSFGTGDPDTATGSPSRLWTFRLRQGNVGLFVDPDSILYFILQPRLRVPVSVPPQFDTLNARAVLTGPKNGFDYFYYVTVVDTTVNGEDLTLRSDGQVGPLRPTGGPVASNLEVIRVLPNPYVFHADWDLPDKRKIRWIRLPGKCSIEVYSVAGDRVVVLQHNNPQDDGQDWDVKNGQGNDVSSGIYIWRVSTPDGRERVGRMTIVR